MNRETTELLVLRDEAGNVYMLPQAVLEQHRASAEQRAALEEMLGDDVSGFGMGAQYLTESRAGQHQAALRDEAAREQLLDGAEPAEEEPRLVRGPSIFGYFVQRLHNVRPRSGEDRAATI